MMRGTFANICLKNLLLPGIEGGVTLHPSSKEPISIFDAAMKYKKEGTPLIIIAGKEYGSGSSRDWAAKGPALLGVRAVIAESFERIHRSNLIGMGILPLQFEERQNYQTLGLSGFEVFDIDGLADDLKPRKKITITAISQDGSKKNFTVSCRIETPNEVDYYKHNGILQYVLRSLLIQDTPVVEQKVKPIDENNAQKYRILFKGEIDEGQELGTVKKRLTQLFKTSPERIEKLFTGKPIMLNYNIDQAKAQEYSNELRNAGALCVIEPMPKTPSAAMNKKIEVQPLRTVPKVNETSIPNIISSKNSDSTKSIGSTSSHSKLFLTGWTVAASCIILLPILYIVLMLSILNMTYYYFEDNIYFFDDHSIILGLLLYIIPILIGILLVAAMAKPLIARPSAKKLFIPLSRKKEPALYAFIEKLCRAIGSKIPNSIEVDCSVNTSANYQRRIISFLEEDLTLTIGLPIISEMTITEFTNLLAHEFGQFTKKTEMRLSYIISSINLWFSRVVYEQDVIDNKLATLSLTASVFLTQIPLNIIKSFIWLSRKILTVFLLAGHIISRFFIRQTEFEADNYSVQLAGFESFRSSLNKLRTLDSASIDAFSKLKTQRNPNDNSLPDDFVLLISTINRQFSDKSNLKPRQNTPQGKIRIRPAYPSYQERIDHAKKIVSKDIIQSDKPASTLFTNFEELSKTASVLLYRETLGLRFNKDDLVPTSQFGSNSGQTSETTKIDSNFF